MLFLKNNNFIFISIFYFICYCFLNYFKNEFDFLHFYEVVLKVKEGETLYLDYNLWYGPHLPFFLTILKKLFILNFATIFIFGFIQNLLIAFIILKIFQIFVKDEDYYPHIFFTSLIWFNPSITGLYWDYYSFFFGLLATYFYLTNKKILSSFIFSTIFFLKQTQGIFFFILFLILLIIDLFKKEINYKLIFFFILGVLLNLFVIFLFFDLKNYYNNSILFIFPYTDSLYTINYEFFYKYILQFLKIQIDQHIIFSNTFWSSNGIISYYFIFVLPFHILLIYFLLHFKNYKENFFLFIFLVLIISACVAPLIGRGYFSKVFIIHLCTYILLFLCISTKYKRIILFFTSLIFGAYFVLYCFKQINFDKNYIIRNPNNIFLNLNLNFYKNEKIFMDTKQVLNFIIHNNLKNIFVTGIYSRIPVILSNQPSDNHELYFYTSWQPPANDFPVVLAKNLNKKNSKYLITERSEFEKFIKYNELMLKFLLNYELYFENDSFLIFRKK